MIRSTLNTIAAIALLGLYLAPGGCAGADRDMKPTATNPDPPAATESSTSETAADTTVSEQEPSGDVQTIEAQKQSQDQLARETAKANEGIAAKQREEKEKQVKDKRKALDKKRRDIVRLERELNVARRNLEKARLSAEHSKARNAAAIDEAESALAVANRRLVNFREHTTAERIAEAELSLRQAEDRYKEAQEELNQLELMYQEDEFAEQTKEIVLERGRRRLERSKSALDLQRERLATLKDRTIPFELTEHELGVRGKEEALKRARENAETSRIDQEIGLINAEGKIDTLEYDLADARETLEELEVELGKLEKELEEMDTGMAGSDE